MNEIKEICAVMLDEPEPQLRAGAEVWAHARSATRRRHARRLVGTGVGGAGLAVVLVSAGLLGGPGAGHEPAVGGGPAIDRPAPAERVPDMVAAAQRTLPDAPTPDQLRANADQIFQTLFAAVPAGYQAQREFGDDTFPLVHVYDPANGGLKNSNPDYAATASVLIRVDGREGALAAFVRNDGKPAPTRDLCATTIDERVGPPVNLARTCQVITVGGLPIRVTTHHDPEELEVTVATWFVRNGYVCVRVAQGLPRYTPDPNLVRDAPNAGGDVPKYRPPLTHPVFTPQQVASIAANPALLP